MANAKKAAKKKTIIKKAAPKKAVAEKTLSPVKFLQGKSGKIGG